MNYLFRDEDVTRLDAESLVVSVLFNKGDNFWLVRGIIGNGGVLTVPVIQICETNARPAAKKTLLTEKIEAALKAEADLPVFYANGTQILLKRTCVLDGGRVMDVRLPVEDVYAVIRADKGLAVALPSDASRLVLMLQS